MMNDERIYNEKEIAACYFRTAAQLPARKCLIQITERCNLRCKHCFVSADNEGSDMEYKSIIDYIIPAIIKNNISKVTLTGGEPLLYPRLADLVNTLSDQGVSVGICTNGVLVNEELLELIKNCKGVHFNVSLDGFSPNSHGRFRGNEKPKVFSRIIENIKLLGRYHMLKGILVTPNVFTPLEEYIELCDFAKKAGAEYVLMNPLSEFGRGESNVRYGLNKEELIKLKSLTLRFNQNDFQMVYIRFPRTIELPVSKCHAGDILYVFTNGNVAYCPYMAFASKGNESLYNENQFILGNCFSNSFDWKLALDKYTLPCIDGDCTHEIEKRDGCFAIKIANGLKLGDQDPIVIS